jgi:hypothetical protein
MALAKAVDMFLDGATGTSRTVAEESPRLRRQSSRAVLKPADAVSDTELFAGSYTMAAHAGLLVTASKPIATQVVFQNFMRPRF